jgi:hypothetical protein
VKRNLKQMTNIENKRWWWWQNCVDCPASGL